MWANKAKKIKENNKTIPKSLRRIVRFYRFFGFSFSGFNLEKKPKTCCNCYSIILNIFMIIGYFFGGIVNYLVRDPMALRETPKLVLKVVLTIGMCIISIDLFASFCFSLKSGGKLIELLDDEETHAIDNNVKIANRILGSFFLVTLMLNILSFILFALDPMWRGIYSSISPFFIIFGFVSLSIPLTTLLNVSWYFSVIYVYITIIIRKQIQLLEDEVSKGNNYQFN
jgi:hypothetical protein